VTKSVSQETGESSTRSPVFQFLERLDGVFTVITTTIGAVLVVITVLMVTYSVIMRYVLGIPQTWTDEMAGYFLAVIVMFGVSDALRHGDHIGIDLMVNKLPARWQSAAEIWGLMAVVLVSLAMLYSSYQMVAFSFTVELISDGYVEVPMWLPQSSLLVGYFMLLLSATNRLLGVCFSRKDDTGADTTLMP